MTGFNHRIMCAIYLAAALIPVQVNAQTDDTPQSVEAPSPVDEIIVTATKRPQNAGDVAISLSVKDGTSIENNGIDSLIEIARETPNMTMFSAGPSSRFIQLRGISTIAGRSTVGYSLDDISLAGFSVFQADPFLYDLDRVEILRGPQGTLFGEGSMGGSIRLITKQPEFETFSIKARATGSKTEDADDSQRLDGAINLPIGSLPLALRLTGTYDRRGGFIDQPALGKENANYEDRDEGRGTIKFAPFDGTQISLMTSAKNITYGANGTAFPDYTQDARIDTTSTDKMRLYNINLAQDLKLVDMFISLSQFDRSFARRTDSRDELPATLGLDMEPAASALMDSVNAVPILDAGDSRYDMAELRFTSEIITWLNGVVGFYYADKNDEQIAKWDVDLDENLAANILPILAGVLPGLPNAPQFPLLDVTYVTDQTQRAAYLHADINLTSYASLAIGTRYTREEITVTTQGTSSLLPADGTYKDDLSVLTPRAHLAFDFKEILGRPAHMDHGLIYLSAARGYRSGGANAAVTGPLGDDIDPAFRPDYLWTYELGTKLSFLQGAFSTELAVYYNDWSNVQAWVAGNLFPYIKNVGDAQGLGVDAQITLKPLSWTSLVLTGGYNDVHFVTSTADKAKGDPTDNAPKWSASASLSLAGPLFWGMSGHGMITYSFEDTTHYIYRSAAIHNQVGPLHFLTARLGVDIKQARLSIFADNLTDYRGRTDANRADDTQAARARPRTIGLEISMSLN